MSRVIIQKSQQYFSESEKHLVIQDYLDSKLSKQFIWQKYTGELKEHGTLLKWMRQLGYATAVIKKQNGNIATKRNIMAKKQAYEHDFATLQLEKRILDLEKQLKEAELKAIAFSTMVDIAEKEFKIPIRKKLNTKP
jgi:transposase